MTKDELEVEPNMNLYKLVTVGDDPPGETIAVQVVAAETPLTARRLVCHGDEGSAVWTDPLRCHCYELAVDVTGIVPGVVCWQPGEHHD